MNAIQMETIAARIPDPVTRERFVRMQQRANELMLEGSQLRLQAWSEFRRATGETKRIAKVGQYA